MSRPAPTPSSPTASWNAGMAVSNERHVPACLGSVDVARCRITAFVANYKFFQLHCATGNITPTHKLHNLQLFILAVTDRKLEDDRRERQVVCPQAELSAEVAG